MRSGSGKKWPAGAVVGFALALLASMVGVPPAHAVDSVQGRAECMIPDPQPGEPTTGPGSTWQVLFGWEAQGPDGGPPLEIPPGPNNRISSGTLVSGPLPTTFTKPVVDADGNPAHVVWPPFVWNPPSSTRSGRTQWWTAAPVRVQVKWGQRATWRLGSRDFSLNVGGATQRCSQHLFLSKTWDGSPTPPADLDVQTYELRARMTSNPNEPNVLNTGAAVCRYQELDPPSPFPYGQAFADPPQPSDRLNCVYTNTGLPYSVDEAGLWIPKAGRYIVEESGVPPGWSAGDAVGVERIIDFTNPDSVAQCGYYPAFGTSAARPDSDGSVIPLLGRAANKWCLQPVDNVSEPASISVTKSVQPAGTTDWAFDFTLDPAPPAGEATLTATSQNPTVTWSGLQSGTSYTVTETPVDGFQSGAIDCGDGTNSITPTPGSAVECTVTNVAQTTGPQTAALRVVKSVTGDGAPADWSFQFDITPAPLDGPASVTVTDEQPSATFTGLEPGTTYTLSETDAEGFTSTIDCGDGTATATPEAGDEVECRAENAVEVPEPTPTPTATPSPSSTPTPTPSASPSQTPADAAAVDRLPDTGAPGLGPLLAAAGLLVLAGVAMLRAARSTAR